ncbi:CFEM domain family protein [Aspergillus niger]|uniref:DUF4419 domain-containing protein n=1 Tax=Aspergillus lacticoffeatus (strain CBS 101883) TaxID=1450533 RepID=UPI000D7F058F|nr:uncharacterized protein BO96DRAFT_132126 [Aspergillus niger CBS 101883]PYH53339.1 hypothetical protein BO96DRAFT_132126 [Aspergillus niger CBS 101883]GJP88467.1 CFEM domain family protein [Aspergillus niger]
MPVTLTTSSSKPEAWGGAKADTAESLLEESCPENARRCKQLFQSSFTPQQLAENHISSSSNGLVHAVYRAYSHHHHLTLRPEDVWFAILSQLSFYINEHAEDLRSHFVAHEGKEELSVRAVGTIHSVDLGALAVQMTEEIQKKVVDPELRTWLMPAFSTTTVSDQIVAAVLMMGAMQQYFSYAAYLMCGIPSVTLLGEREDWVQLLSKLDKLPDLGAEPAQFARLLRPVLHRFIISFDEPTSDSVREFWGLCADRISGGSGPSYLSGWITAFCYWNEKGQPMDKGTPGCELDGVQFHRVDFTDIPGAFASVPMKVNDNGTEYETELVAGVVGIHASCGRQTMAAVGDTDARHDMIQPASGWWMYEKEAAAENPE